MLKLIKDVIILALILAVLLCLFAGSRALTNTSCAYEEIKIDKIEIFDNSSNHIACQGAPKIIKYKDMAWVIGHYLTKKTVGSLYNLTTMQKIKGPTTLLGKGEIHFGGMDNFGDDINQNWYIFIQRGSGGLYYFNSSISFQNLSFGEGTLLAQIGNAYSAIMRNPLDENEVWILYRSTKYNLNKITYDCTTKHFSNASLFLKSLPVDPRYIKISKIRGKYIMTLGNEHDGSESYMIYLSSIDGRHWDQGEMMRVSKNTMEFASNFVTLIEKRNQIIAAAFAKVRGEGPKAVFFTGEDFDSLAFQTAISTDIGYGETYGEIVNGKQNGFYYTAMRYTKGYTDEGKRGVFALVNYSCY